MKNILYSILITLLFVEANAQEPVIDIRSQNGKYLTNAYYKDVQNLLNQFEGTYIYSNGQEYLKIVLLKKVMQHTANRYYEDLIIGESQYVDTNGNAQFNTLKSLSINYFNQNQHSFSGNDILDNGTTPECSDCQQNEKRLRLGFYETYAADVVIKKTVINGQDAIILVKTIIYVTSSIDGTMQLAPKLADGTYILIKQ